MWRVVVLAGSISVALWSVGILGWFLLINNVVYVVTRHAPGEKAGALTIAGSVPNCLDTAGQHLNYNASTNAWTCGTITGGTNTAAAMVVGAGASLSATGDATKWVHIIKTGVRNSNNQFGVGDECFLFEGYVTQPVYNDAAFLRHKTAVLTVVVRNRFPDGSEAAGTLCPEGMTFMDDIPPAQQP